MAHDIEIWQSLILCFPYGL